MKCEKIMNMPSEETELPPKKKDPTALSDLGVKATVTELHEAAEER
jgi:hypothetical protein